MIEAVDRSLERGGERVQRRYARPPRRLSAHAVQPHAGDAELERPPFSIICLSQSSWDADLPTNRQQIMRRASERGHRVLFVDTGPFLGRRVADVLRRRAKPAALLDVIRPVDRTATLSTLATVNLFPWGHRNRFTNQVNNWLNALNLKRVGRRLPGAVVLWIYDPCCGSMIGACGEDMAAYDCVDDYPSLAFYGPAEKALARAGDREAATRSAVVFTTTSTLFQRHAALNPNVHLVGNVGDYTHFEGAVDRSIAASDVTSLPRPVIGFAGRFMTGKIDFALIDATARRHPDWTILLIGPADDEALLELERLTRLTTSPGSATDPMTASPRYVAAFDVGLCPYQWNDWMRGGFPLKVYEYLAAGKPIVASGNPDLEGMAPDVVLTRGPDEFVAAIEEALLHRSPKDVERRRRLARQNTWESRTERVLQLTQERLAS